MKLDISTYFDNTTLVILDVESIAKADYVSTFLGNKGGKPAFSFLLNGKEHNSTVIFGLLSKIVNANYYLGDVDFIASFDTKKGFLSYINKSNFETAFQQKHEMFNQLTSLRHAFKYMGMQVLEQDGMESSSMIYKAVQDNYDSYEKIIIYTKDKQLYPLVDDKVSIVIPSNKYDLTSENFENWLEVPPTLYRLKLALLGDSTITSVDSRNNVVVLKGVKGVGKAKFNRIVKNYDFSKKVSKNIIESTLLNETQKKEALSIYQWLLPRETTIETYPKNMNKDVLKQFLEFYQCTSLLNKVV